MKRLMTCAAAAVLAGCATSDKTVKAGAAWAKDYYNQPNTAEIVVVEGTNVSWKIENASRIVFSTPVPTKSVIPREPGIMDGLFDTLKTVAPWLMMGWMVHDSGGLGSSTHTVNNAAAQ